jgi:hypothetical protein
MTDRELMQQALDALTVWELMQPQTTACAVRIPAIEALRARLAQPEPEPVAWFCELPDNKISIKIVGKPTEGNWKPLYTAPPPHEEGCAECGKKSSDGWALYCVKCTEREWVGLTDEQVDGYWDESVSTGCRLSFGMGVDYANRVLKEKNT